MNNISLASASYKGLASARAFIPRNASQQRRGKGVSRCSTRLHPSSAVTASLLSVIIFPGTENTHFSDKATGTLAQCLLPSISVLGKKENVTGTERKFFWGEFQA